MQVISIDDFRGTVSKEVFDKCTSNVISYFMTSDNYQSSDIALKVIKNIDGSFSMYEEDKGCLINAVRKYGKDDFVVVPMGIGRIFSLKIFDELRNNFMDSAFYKRMMEINELPENEKLDGFMFYLINMIADAYSLEMDTIRVAKMDGNGIKFSGRKKEFFFLDKNSCKDFQYGNVGYNVEIKSRRYDIIIRKVYEDCGLRNDNFVLDFNDLIDWKINEFAASKK